MCRYISFADPALIVSSQYPQQAAALAAKPYNTSLTFLDMVRP